MLKVIPKKAYQQNSKIVSFSPQIAHDVHSQAKEAPRINVPAIYHGFLRPIPVLHASLPSPTNGVESPSAIYPASMIAPA